MKILINVDTNDYNDDNEQPGEPNYTPQWSLFGLNLATLHQWRSCGQTEFWTIDGTEFCGTQYECYVNYKGSDGELLLRCLIAKIEEYCGFRFMKMWIDGVLVEYTDDDLVCMRPEWLEAMKE